MNIKKIIREEIDGLDWIKKSEGNLLGSGDSRYSVMLEYFNNNGVLNYNGWRYSIDRSGSVEWSKKGHDTFYYATPYWDNSDVMPIDYTNDEDGYGYVNKIQLPDFIIEDELINWLINDYPEIVYQEIIKHELRN